MMQGDNYNIGLTISNNAGSIVTPSDIIDVEITINGLAKTYAAGELVYTDGVWGYPVTQDDSFTLRPGAAKAQVRVKWADGTVEGQDIYGLRIHEAMSREVI